MYLKNTYHDHDLDSQIKWQLVLNELLLIQNAACETAALFGSPIND